MLRLEGWQALAQPDGLERALIVQYVRSVYSCVWTSSLPVSMSGKQPIARTGCISVPMKVVELFDAHH